MKLFGVLPVLSTLLAIGQVSPAVAEPIPAEARVHSLRRLQDGAVVENIAKRALTDDLFGTDGSGARYWAWARVAYDDEYNSHEPGKRLGNPDGKDWAKLDGSDIFVKGFAGPPVSGFLHWPSFTGMKVVVGKDETKKAIVMAFKGTNDKPTIKQDLKFVSVKDSAGAIPGTMEKGFFECYDSVYKKAFEWAKQWAEAEETKEWDIVITGHSLGGATALIAAAAWGAANPGLLDRTTVFTYGAPRAGNLEFQQSLATNQAGRMANFEHLHDFFPHVPLMHVPGAQFANPGNRHIFEPKGSSPSWFDSNLWRPVESPDRHPGTKEAVVAAAKEMWDNFARHRNYFSTTTVPGRSIGFDNGMTSIHKRDRPSGSDFQTAEGLVGQMRQSNELKGDLELTPKLEDFTAAMKITNEQPELVDALNSYEDEEERVNFLKVVEIVAMDQPE